MQNSPAKYPFRKSTLKLIPEEPGVYIFYDLENNIIYIGKSKSLRGRLRTYLSNNIFGKTDKLVSNVKSLSYIRVESEVEALLLEAKLVRKHMPYYNIDLKDDKSSLFVCVTNDKYSRLVTTRLRQLNKGFKYTFGPFIDSQSIYQTLKYLRNICPYSTHLPTKRPCFYSQLGLCSPCPSIIDMESDPIKKAKLLSQYKSNIKYLKRFFRGHFGALRKTFIDNMLHYSKLEDFENAQLFKDRLRHLEIMLAPSDRTELYSDDPYYINILKKKGIEGLEKIINIYLKKNISIKRIECYDISHLQGSHSAGSMVTFINSSPEKKYYRHFRLSKSENNDTKSLTEIAKRRIMHMKDWGTSDLIIVDGGKGQIGAFKNVFDSVNIPVVGMAKRYERLIIPLPDGGFVSVAPKDETLKLIQRIRNEAHRFAQRYHHMLVNKYLIKPDKMIKK